GSYTELWTGSPAAVTLYYLLLPFITLYYPLLPFITFLPDTASLHLCISASLHHVLAVIFAR
ncbi:hypothetical protein, partial [Yersinia pseudotuberculosis]|uniref:hypothetical protein n=1 Tax=Yersinia pseudotuberculosis TaxID=633 RepID=UPI001E36F2C9